MSLILLITIIFSISVVMRFIVNFLLSKGGWSQLAQNFQSEHKCLGNKIPLTSIGLNKVLYKNSVRISYNEEGMHLRLLPIFKMFHDPLFIPWFEIKDVFTHSSLLGTRYKLIVGYPEIAYMIVNENVYNYFQQYLNKDIK